MNASFLNWLMNELFKFSVVTISMLGFTCFSALVSFVLAGVLMVALPIVVVKQVIELFWGKK